MKRRKPRKIGIIGHDPSPVTCDNEHPWNCKSGDRIAEAMGIRGRRALINRDGYSLNLSDAYEESGDARLVNKVRQNPDRSSKEERIKAQKLEDGAVKRFLNSPQEEYTICTPGAANVIKSATGFTVPEDGHFREITHPKGKFYASQVPHPDTRNNKWDRELENTKRTIGRARGVSPKK